MNKNNCKKCFIPNLNILHFVVQVESMQRPGTEAIRTQIQPIKPNWEITKVTSSQKYKENIWSTVRAALSQKVATQQPKPNKKNIQPSFYTIRGLLKNKGYVMIKTLQTSQSQAQSLTMTFKFNIHNVFIHLVHRKFERKMSEELQYEKRMQCLVHRPWVCHSPSNHCSRNVANMYDPIW